MGNANFPRIPELFESKLRLLSFTGKTRTLHLTWFAFFLSFLVWFNHAPLLASISTSLGLSSAEVKALLTLNVALAIPARVVVGMLVDRYGPRIMYSLLLFISSLLCFAFAMANSFATLAITRFLLGFVGAGFVVGIRLIGEWFPARQVGIAEGIYGGWGNFGSAAAAITLPSVALWVGGENGWRWAVASTGFLALVYSVVFYRMARNTPKGSTYFKPKKTGAMEVTSKGDIFFYMMMNLPMYLALGILTWNLGPARLGMLSAALAYLIVAGLLALFVYQLAQIWRVNKHLFKEDVPQIHRYKFKQVAILDLAYLVTFGSELAVVSMLPLFFMDTFALTQVHAGLLASAFAFMNLIARPSGGFFSDRFGRKKSLTVLIAGLASGYFLMSNIESSWSLPLAVSVTMLCSFFVQAGEGAVFAIVPLVKRRMTGQIAGMAGAYGNVGAVLFLTVFSFVTPRIFLLVIVGAALLALVAVQFLEEPEGQTAEVLPDGTVQMIDVS